jgi:peptidoglycan-associated lipoprotein
MMNTQTSGFKLVLALGLALSLAACQKKSATAGLGADGLGGPGDGLAGSAAQVPGSEEDFAANIGDRVFFENDQTSLTAEARDILVKQASWLQQYPDVAIQIEGHADERGTREYNISLSARRATNISSIAYGKERPAKLCDGEECWSQNRRAVTVITSGARTS